LANANYRFKVVAYDGSNDNCATGTVQYTVDNVSAWTIINNPSNLFLLGASADPSGSAGELAYRTDIPCFRAFTTFWDCLVTLTAPQTLLNKTLTAPTITSPVITGTVSGSAVIPSSDVVAPYAANGSAPVTNGLARLVTVGTVSTAATTLGGATGGAIGICVSSCNLSTLYIQQQGVASCIFDGNTTAGDYVQQSATQNGQCTDAGASFPGIGQVLGRALATATAGPLQVVPVQLFPPEIKAGLVGAQTGCTNFTPVTVTNTVATTNLLSCTVPANALSQGSLLEVDMTGIESYAGAPGTVIITVSLGAGTSCSSTFTTAVANNQPWNFVGKFAVLTSGAGGTANWACNSFSPASFGFGANGTVGAPTIAINTTIANTLLITETMSAANAGNSVTGQLLKGVVF
jgi:hypothetical protein